MRFLVDAQLPPAVARWLAGQGHVAEHVADRGLASASDPAVWDCAVKENAVIVTKDEDFAVRKAREKGRPAVIWIRFGNTRRNELIRRLHAVLPDVVAAIERGDELIEVD